MSDLAAKVVSLTLVNEAYEKEKEEDSALLAKALTGNAALQAEVEALKKEMKKKKKTKKLENEVADCCQGLCLDPFGEVIYCNHAELHSSRCSWEWPDEVNAPCCKWIGIIGRGNQLRG